jgi:hypothetical protein
VTQGGLPTVTNLTGFTVLLQWLLTNIIGCILQCGTHLQSMSLVLFIKWNKCINKYITGLQLLCQCVASNLTMVHASFYGIGYQACPYFTYSCHQQLLECIPYSKVRDRALTLNWPSAKLSLDL